MLQSGSSTVCQIVAGRIMSVLGVCGPHGAAGLPHTQAVVGVLDGGETASDDVLCCLHRSLLCF